METPLKILSQAYEKQVSGVFGRENGEFAQGDGIFYRKWGELLVPYEKSILGHDRTFDIRHRTFDLFISENLGFLIKRLMKVSNV
jgi:hypothetical protein